MGGEAFRSSAPPSLPLRHGPVPADAKVRAVLLLHLLPPRRPRAAGAHHGGAFYLTLVPIRPRSRGERRSLRTFSPGVSLRPHLAFNPDTPRRLSTPLLTPLNSTPTFARMDPRPSEKDAGGATAKTRATTSTARGSITSSRAQIASTGSRCWTRSRGSAVS